MQKRIRQIAAGKFESDQPSLSISDEELFLTVTEGQEYTGEFEITSENHIPVRGIVYSTHPRMECLTPQFEGENIRIRYQFHSKGLVEGQEEKGAFVILCNQSVHSLSFCVSISRLYAQTATGAIRSLSDFTALAKESWQEVQETLEKLEEEKKRLEKEIRDDSQSLEKLKKDHDELQAFIARAGMEIQRQRQKLEDFKQLKRDYDSYESNREVLEKCKKEEARYQENQKLARDRQRKLLEEKKTLEYSINMLGREEERLSEKYARYAAYENAEQNFHIDESLSADQMEARYGAITSVLSQELKDLEAQEKECGNDRTCCCRITICLTNTDVFFSSIVKAPDRLCTLGNSNADRKKNHIYF